VFVLVRIPVICHGLALCDSLRRCYFAACKLPANSLPDFTGYLATIEDSWCDKNSLAADV
jgi:hypothetical protein